MIGIYRRGKQKAEEKGGKSEGQNAGKPVVWLSGCPAFREIPCPFSPFLFLCVVSFVCISAVTADGAFEDVELGARPLGMGSAFVAAADGASAIFWNSAGIVRVDGRELTMSYMELYDLVSYSCVGYAQRIKIGSIGFGLVSSSDVDGVYREMTLALSAAGEIYRGLSIGSNTEYLSSAANTGDVRIGNGRGLSLDLGCQYHVWEDLASFGITLQNLVGYVSYNREAVGDIPGQEYSQRPDFSYKVGAGIDLGRLLWENAPALDNVTLAAELSDGDIHIGTEFIFWDVVAARAGFRTGNALTRSIAVGFGLELSGLTFDYAYVGSEVGSQTSQFSVSINW
jgi:hypothetical protein